MSHIKATPTHEILTYILHGTDAKIVQCGCVDSNHYIYVHHRIIKSRSRPITMRWNSLQGKALCTSTVVLWPTLAIACSSLDAGHMIDGQDRATADFRDTELSSN